MFKVEDIKNIRLTEKPIALYVLLREIQDGLLLLDTDFQRRAGLWDIGKKSRLIESMILKLPINPLYFDASNDDNRWRVIDGLQRLGAARDFISDKNFALTQLDFLSNLEGKKFDDLSRLQQRNIEQYSILAYIAEKGTPKEIITRIFNLNHNFKSC